MYIGVQLNQTLVTDLSILLDVYIGDTVESSLNDILDLEVKTLILSFGEECMYSQYSNTTGWSKMHCVKRNTCVY